MSKRSNGGYTDGSKMPKGARWITEERYPYEDAGGRLYMVVKREKAWFVDKHAGSIPVIDTKTGKQKKQCPQNWIGFADGKKPPFAHNLPFRLPELIKAIAKKEVIFIAEGEPKVELLRSWGLAATCNAGGVGQWTFEHANEMRGAGTAVILPDNDQSGRDHSDKVGRTLEKIATKRLLLELPGLPQHGDIVDWVKAGGTKQEFLKLAEAAPEWKPYNPDAGGGDDELTSSTLDSAPASSFSMKAIQWVWLNRFARGKIGLIVGMPERAKSLMLNDMAARVTTGSKWPCDEGVAPKGRVLLLTAEDDIEDTVVPRLRAAGADLDLVEILQMVRDTETDPEHPFDRPFNLAKDVALLGRKIDQFDDVVMVQVDPLTAYFGVGAVDTFRTSDVRGVLMPLKELAERKRILVVGVMHFNKKVDITNVILRISDSVAFGATARHVYATIDDVENHRRLLVRGKNNLAPDTEALSYGTELAQVGIDEETKETIWAPRVVWHGHVEVAAADAMAAENGTKSRSPVALEKAKAFLLQMFADGPASAAGAEDAAKREGIAKRTLRRAKDELGVTSEKQPDGSWLWLMPGQEAPKQTLY